MKLYFGNTTATTTTFLLLGLAIFWIWTFMTGKTVGHWGLKSLFLIVYGLVICCFAATRDGYDKSVQFSIDGSCAPGLFSITSVPAIIGYVGAAIIVISAIATLILRSQQSRETLFYIMSSGVLLKVVTVEIARIFS